MADYIVTSGESSYGITVDNGQTMEVMSGGTTSDVKIDAGGLETGDDGGSDFTPEGDGEGALSPGPAPPRPRPGGGRGRRGGRVRPRQRRTDLGRLAGCRERRLGDRHDGQLGWDAGRPERRLRHQYGPRGRDRNRCGRRFGSLRDDQ